MPIWHDIAISHAPHPSRLKTLLGCAIMAMATGCASSSSPQIDSLDGPPSSKRAKASPGYTLTDADRDLECNVIRGRMKVAIFHIKSEQNLPQSTDLSKGLQGAAAGIFGGTTYGTNPNAIAAKEKARLYAYNGLLKEKNCTTFDLQTELASAGRS